MAKKKMGRPRVEYVQRIINVSAVRMHVATASTIEEASGVRKATPGSKSAAPSMSRLQGNQKLKSASMSQRRTRSATSPSQLAP
jgi:hypothetical protein